MNCQWRLILTGAHGFVAGGVLTQAGPDWEVHAVSRGEPLGGTDTCHWHQFDALDGSSLAQLFHSVQPHAVIHTAAVADIDFCQANPDLARAVNVDLTDRLTQLCADHGARMVFCSTDTVFDGEHAPYRETDNPSPVNAYAETKVAAERLVLRLGAHAVVSRLSLVVGLPMLGAGNSFLARLLPALKAGRTVAVPAHEVRTPIDVVTVSRALLELARGAHHGLVHLAGNDRVGRLDLSRRIAARFGFPTGLVVAADPAAIRGRAPRPRDVSLANEKARAELRTPMCNLDDALSLILECSHHPTV